MPFRALATSALSRVDGAAACLLPIVTTLSATLISIQPIHIPGYMALTPAFTLMAVYHWTIYRPDLLPPLGLFLIGVVQDLLAAAPPGTTALLLLLVRAVVLRQRRRFVNRPFPFVWGGFATLTAGAALFFWVLQSTLGGVLLELRGTFFRAVVTISLFPVASFLLGRAQRALMDAD
jgi:rod shape-determining protein MreD